ncbi:uncharacterized protein LOC141588195 [Silene latifolia]|uniref:uncharacterized protein LOC141588195 n=1 Tax=Silene latifolia TaxID=37657 RepID=UPI003D778146
MESPEFSHGIQRVPRSCDAHKTKDMSDIIGIPVIDLNNYVEEPSTSSGIPVENEEGWTVVSGKRTQSPKEPVPEPNPKKLLQLTDSDVSSEIKYWESAVVCYVLGGNPSWESLHKFVDNLWGEHKFDKISFFPNGVFIVRFPSMESQSLVLQQGFPMFENKPLVVRPWSESCSLLKERVQSVPIWLRLCGLPLIFWSLSSLEKLVGLLGKFLKRDAATEAKTRLGYARLLVEVEIGQEFPANLSFLDEKGNEISIQVEYEWKPTVCSTCKGIGHTHEMCKPPKPARQDVRPPKPTAKPPQKVWRPVQKVVNPPVVSSGPAATPPPFGGVTYHDSSLITPVSVLQQVTRQEHQSGSTMVSPSKSYAAAVSARDKGKSKAIETKVKLQDFSKVLNNLGTHWQGVNNNVFHNGGRVWLIWNPGFYSVTILSVSSQVISAKVVENGSGDSFYFSVVYGFNEDDLRGELWEHLSTFHDNYPGPWVVCGDFNNVLHFNERIGREVTWNEIAAFRECVDYCGLQDLTGKGAFFTWNNKQSPSVRGFSRIDRFLINDDWMAKYPDAYVHFLPEGLFDHNPSVCFRRQDRLPRKPPFRYFNMWSMDEHFAEIVHATWDITISGTLMYTLVQKLKLLKNPLKALNNNRYSDIEKSVGVAKLILEDLHKQMHDNPTYLAILAAEREAATSYEQLSKMQHSYLAQKAKVEWIKYGDENTRFFHSHLRARHTHNRVMTIKNQEGVMCSTPEDIEEAFLSYYKNLLGTSKATTPVHFPTVRTGPTIQDSHVILLLAPVTTEEIRDSIFSIPSTKAPGPDGYSSQFFKDAWEIVGPDVIAAIQNFFHHGQLLKQLNTTTLTLIPKTSQPGSVLEFRPIACCNTVYKAIAKILSNRLNKVLPEIISPNQGGFVKGRSIVDNVLICQDLVRLYNRKAASPRCLIKIDLRKAYDSVEWSFLQQMLEALNFPQKFIQLVMALCDLPYLFSSLLMGVYLVSLMGRGDLDRVIPCLLYFSPSVWNDLLLFCKGTEPAIMWMLRGFATFSAATGLHLNKDKSEIYFNGMLATHMDNIMQVSGFHRGTLPFKYLGVLISSKKLTKSEGMKLTERIVARIRGWSAKYSLIFGRNYLWGGRADYIKAPNVGWDTCCMPKTEGGLGLKDSCNWNVALLGKYVWWLASKKDHMWVKWVNHVYMKGQHWSDYQAPPDSS